MSAAKGALIDETHTLRVSDTPDTAAGAGMLDAEGIVAFDATGLTDEQLASINPADGATLAAAGVTAAEVKKTAEGVAEVTFKDLASSSEENAETTAELIKKKAKLPAEATLSFDAVEKKADGERVLYVAVPYAASALTVTEDGAAYNPEAIDFALASTIYSKAVQEEKVEGAEAVNDTLAEEMLAVNTDVATQEVAFPKPAEPVEPEPTEPEPAEPSEPTDEPTDEPADEPTDEPADEPADESTDEPAAEDEPAEDSALAEYENDMVADADRVIEGSGIESFDELADAVDRNSRDELTFADNGFADYDVVEIAAALMTRSAANTGISLFALPPRAGILNEANFNPTLVAQDMGTPLGKDEKTGADTYLINDKNNPKLSLSCLFKGQTGYMGALNLYGDDYYGSMVEDGDGNEVYQRRQHSSSNPFNDLPADVTTLQAAIDYAEKTDNRQPTKKPDGTPVNPDVDSANIDVKSGGVQRAEGPGGLSGHAHRVRAARTLSVQERRGRFGGHLQLQGVARRAQRRLQCRRQPLRSHGRPAHLR